MNEAVQIFGYTALERLTDAPNFNNWMYQTISPYLTGNILEIGSGIGNISSYFIEAQKPLTLSDFDPKYVGHLQEKYKGSHCVKDILQLDLAAIDFSERFVHLSETYDAIFLLNVLEHIEHDSTAIKHLHFLLKPGGKVVILVPSYSFLFSKMDQLLGHFRRYTIDSLSNVVTQNNLKVKKAFHFNALGLAGWFWNKVFNQAEISYKKMNLFNQLVPFAKLLDKLFLQRVGLSTIVVASKPERP